MLWFYGLPSVVRNGTDWCWCWGRHPAWSSLRDNSLIIHQNAVGLHVPHQVPPLMRPNKKSTGGWLSSCSESGVELISNKVWILRYVCAFQGDGIHLSSAGYDIHRKNLAAGIWELVEVSYGSVEDFCCKGWGRLHGMNKRGKKSKK